MTQLFNRVTRRSSRGTTQEPPPGKSTRLTTLQNSRCLQYKLAHQIVEPTERRRRKREMKHVEWSYHRKNCNSCSKADAFLSQHEIAVKTIVDARTVPLIEADAMKLIDASDDVYVTRGTKVIHFDLKHERPDDQSLCALVIGRSGKLRAPTLQVGKTLIVGFDQETYEQVFR